MAATAVLVATAAPLATLGSVAGASSPAASPIYEIKAGTVSGLGKVLLDGKGYTLYMFVPDKQSGKSTCYGPCASAWPPLLLPSGISRAPAGPGVKSKLLGTTKRRDGTVQVTYDKWPLYLWVTDSGPRQSTGQGINSLGGKWYVISPSGAIVKKRP